MYKNPLISTLIFTTLSFIPTAAGVLLLPLYLNELHAEEYAILSLAGIFAGLVVMLSNFKLDAAMRTFYFDYKENSPELLTYLRQIFTASLLISLGFYFLLLLVGPFLFQLIFKSKELLFYPYGFYSLTAATLAMVKAPYMIFLKNQVKLKEFALYQLGEFSLVVILQAYFILQLGWGLEGAFLGLLFAQLIACGVFLLLQYRLFTLPLQKAYLRPSLKYSLLLLPFVCMNGIMLRGDRILFERFSELGEVGKYALLMTILGLSRLIFNALDNAIRPFLFRLFKEGVLQNKRNIQSLLSFYISIACLFLSGILFGGDFLHLFTDKSSYLEIVPYFAWGVLALLPGILTRIYNLQLVFVKKSNLISSYSVISFLSLIGGFIIWVPIYGLAGALAAIGLSNFISMLLFGLLARKHFSMGKTIFKGARILLITLIIFSVSLSLHLSFPEFPVDFEKIQFPILILLVLGLSYKDIRLTSTMRKDSASITSAS